MKNMESAPATAVDWSPDLSPKQQNLIKLCRAKSDYRKAIGVFGTRWSGKTTGALHAIADHLYNVKGSSVLVLAYTQGTAATSGVWNELVERIIPEWIAANIGMRWEVDPKIHPSTKKLIASVNVDGDIRKIELDTLDDESEVEKKFRSRYYSMIYWSEASIFQQQLTMMTLFSALRARGVAEHHHILLIDANPAEEGQDHFLFYFFYELRISTETVDEEDAAIQKSLILTEWTMQDNPYISETQKAVIRGSYKSDPDLYARYILGKWVKTKSKNSLFADVFIRDAHTVGDLTTKNPEIMIPQENCELLITGSDTGSVNPISYIIEPFPVVNHFRDADGKEHSMTIKAFKVLDEIEKIGERPSVRDFTIEFLERMTLWGKMAGGIPKWRHWADSSATNSKESIADKTVAAEMYIVSSGVIDLVGVEKFSGSVALRIRLLRKLLVEGRLLINAARCPKLMESVQSIKSGKEPMTVPKHSIYKHPFDALTYPLQKECWQEMVELMAGASKVAKTNEGNVTKFVSVPL